MPGRIQRSAASAGIRLALLAAVFSGTGALSACGDDFVSATNFPQFDCSICAEVATRTENCGLLESGTTASDYESICLDSAGRLCDSDIENFLGLAEECLTRSGCSDFSDCYFLVVDSFKDRSDCVGSCIDS